MVTVTRHSQWAVVEVRGDLDADAAPALRHLLAEMIEHDAGDLALDLSGIEFIDPTGLGVLVGILKRAERRGTTIVAVGARLGVRRILEMASLDRLLPTYPSADALPTPICRSP
jgi:anti-sigma B factor antagonist